MYFAKNTQTNEHTLTFLSVWDALDQAEDLGWEEVETELMETSQLGGFELVYEAEFPCMYRYHCGTDYAECSVSANKPDSYCEIHGAE